MNILPNAAGQLHNASNAWPQIQARFSEFLTSVATLGTDPGSPIRGKVSIVPAADGLSCKMTFATVTLQMSLQLYVPEAGSTRGVVVCVLDAPRLDDERPIIGAFSFNSQGVTAIQHNPGDDPMHLNWSSPLIALNFLAIALARNTTEAAMALPQT